MRREDLITFCPEGDIPTVKGVGLWVGEEIKGVCGICYSTPLQAFSYTADDISKYPRLVIKACRWMIDEMNKRSAPVYAVADKSKQSAQGLLSRMGFVESEGVYKWLG